MENSNQINNLDPNFVSGFIDGEGTFSIYFSYRPESKFEWNITPKVSILLHSRDIELLRAIQSFFKVGNVKWSSQNTAYFEVTQINDIETVIVPHFDKYPLMTKKMADFLLFKSVIGLIIEKQHLTIDGLRKIISIKASMNRGLPDGLKKAFPDIIPVSRPLVQNQLIPDPQWVAGFTSGEGCLLVKVRKSSTNRLGLQVELEFQITQHTRDKQLLLSFKNYLGCGRYRERIGGLAGDFNVSKLSDLTEKIIPFFDKYPIRGVKALDFADFKAVAELMLNKEHLTESGLKKIQKIKAGMNSLRKGGL